MAHWLRIRLPVQGMQVRALVREDPHATEQLSPCATTAEARTPRAHAPQQEKPPLSATGKSPHAATKTQCSQKKKKDFSR